MFRRKCLWLVVLTAILMLPAVVGAGVAYKTTLRRWTHGHAVYNPETIGARLIWKATYLSPEFRDVARTKIGEWKKIPPGEATSYPSYLADEEGAFLVSIYTPRGYPAINADADNFWEFTLDLPTGESYPPSSIESVTVTEREKRLFPYINRWGRFYRVKFPVADIQRPFTLALRSAGVTSFLKW